MAQTKKDFKVILPSMGEGVQEATINKWLKSVGDKVQKDEALLEVSTDKVDTEIVSPYSGYLIATFATKDSVVKVNDVIAQISLSKDAAVITQPAKHSSSEATGHIPQDLARQESTKFRSPRTNLDNFPSLPKTYAGSIKSSPLVRKMSKDFNINLADIRGSGQYGRITKSDLLLHMEEHSSPTNIETQQDHFVSPSLVTEKKNGEEYLEGVLVKRTPMSKIRKLTADHMIKSVRTSPHVTTTFEVNLDTILKYKQEKGDAFEKHYGVKLTLTPFFIESCVRALKDHPYVNASVDKYDILLKEDINIGCAVALDSGLVVPVLKKIQNKSLEEIVTRFQTMVTKARDKKLEASDLTGGSFSITNPGMYGSLHSQPIINQPQVAILSVGTITTRCVLIHNKPINQSFCQIGLTFDHRIIDGQGGAFFLRSVKERLENFST